MAEVGKPIALQGLACDRDVRECFSGGIQYISLGQEATLQTAFQEIARDMTILDESRDQYRLANLHTLITNFGIVKDACSISLTALPLRPGDVEVWHIS